MRSLDLLNRCTKLSDSEISMTAANDLTVRRALELAGVEFIDENGGDTATDRAGVVTCPKMTRVAIRTNPKAARDGLSRISVHLVF